MLNYNTDYIKVSHKLGLYKFNPSMGTIKKIMGDKIKIERLFQCSIKPNFHCQWPVVKI